jgi:hypothetical protein
MGVVDCYLFDYRGLLQLAELVLSSSALGPGIQGHLPMGCLTRMARRRYIPSASSPIFSSWLFHIFTPGCFHSTKSNGGFTTSATDTVLSSISARSSDPRPQIPTVRRVFLLSGRLFVRQYIRLCESARGELLWLPSVGHGDEVRNWIRVNRSTSL